MRGHEKSDKTNLNATAIGLFGQILRRAHDAGGNKTVRTTAIAAGASAVAAAGISFLVWQKRHSELYRYNSDEYVERAKLFNDANGTLTDAQRQLAAQVAANVYVVASNTEAGVMSERALYEKFAGDKKGLKHALAILTEAEMIEHIDGIDDAKTPGFRALPGLDYAVQQSDEAHVLHQAVSDILTDN